MPTTLLIHPLLRRVGLLAWLLIGAALAPAMRAQESPEATKTRIESILEDPRYQRELPPGTEIGTGSASRGRYAGVGGANRAVTPGSDWVAMRWFLAIVGGMALAALIAGAFFGHGRTLSPLPAAAPAAPTTTTPIELPTGALVEADRLASEGRFEEAVHELLLAMFEAIRNADRLADRASLTSREAAAAAAVDEPAAQAAMLGLVDVTERATFAKQALGAPDYAHAREQYQVLINTYAPARARESA